MSTASQRNRDFVRRCRLRMGNLRLEGASFTPDSIIRDVLRQPAPSYYADYYRANAILRRALTKGGLEGGRYCKSAMWNDMYADLLDMMNRYPARSFHDIVLDLCTGGVGNPRFYMSMRTARTILRRHIRYNIDF